MNRMLERMVIVGVVMKDVLALKDVKQTWTVRLQALMISLKRSWLILVAIMTTLLTTWNRWCLMH
jgi:hypothetical protein